MSFFLPSLGKKRETIVNKSLSSEMSSSLNQLLKIRIVFFSRRVLLAMSVLVFFFHMRKRSAVVIVVLVFCSSH